MYYLYIVRCCDNTLYTGQTNNLERRIKEHNSNSSKGARYTRMRRPVELVYSEEHETLKEVMLRERQIKTWEKARKERLIISK